MDLKLLSKYITEPIVSIEQIYKGWSSDQKFLITLNKGKYFLRVSKIKQLARKQFEYSYLQKIYETGIRTQQPLSFFKDDKYVFTLLTYIEGVDLEDKLPLLTKKEQFELGKQSGQILKEIHQIKINEPVKKWDEYYWKKAQRNINRYKQCGINIANTKYIIKYISNNKELLLNRPQVFLHGDYHIGNMLLSKKSNLAVIDFNRMDIGDPYDEFNRHIAFTSEVSVPYAIGEIVSYFDNKVPEDFFPLYAFYTATNTLGGIPWAIPFGKSDVDKMIDVTKKVLRDFNNFNQVVPTWFYKYSFND